MKEEMKEKKEREKRLFSSIGRRNERGCKLHILPLQPKKIRAKGGKDAFLIRMLYVQYAFTFCQRMVTLGT